MYRCIGRPRLLKLHSKRLHKRYAMRKLRSEIEDEKEDDGNE